MKSFLKRLFRREPVRRFYTVVFYDPKQTFTRDGENGQMEVIARAQSDRYLADSEETAYAMFRSDNPHCIPVAMSYWK